jgi:hypothetical protein
VATGAASLFREPLTEFAFTEVPIRAEWITRWPYIYLNWWPHPPDTPEQERQRLAYPALSIGATRTLELLYEIRNDAAAVIHVLLSASVREFESFRAVDDNLKTLKRILWASPLDETTVPRWHHRIGQTLPVSLDQPPLSHATVRYWRMTQSPSSRWYRSLLSSTR